MTRNPTTPVTFDPLQRRLRRHRAVDARRAIECVRSCRIPGHLGRPHAPRGAYRIVARRRPRPQTVEGRGSDPRPNRALPPFRPAAPIPEEPPRGGRPFHDPQPDALPAATPLRIPPPTSPRH